jgi:nucleolar protein 9
MAEPEYEHTSDQGKCHRPRRPSPDTLLYLKSLPLDAFDNEEIMQFLCDETSGNEMEFPPVLAASLAAINEIKNEVASLAGDEAGSEILEALAKIALPFSELAARTLLAGTIGYCLHLSTHRYGSHVLQTILQLAVTSESQTDVALHTDAPPLTDIESLPSLSALVLSIHDEILPHVSDLRTHLCGSHVVRTIVCILAGLKMQDHCKQVTRRGKAKKKHKRAKHMADSDVARSFPIELAPIANPRISVNDTGDALEQLTEALSNATVEAPGALQQLSCHSSAGPLLIVLLQALAYRSALSDKHQIKSSASGTVLNLQFRENSAAHLLAERILCWQRGEMEQSWAGDVIYGLAGEVRGSHVLESLFKLCPDSFYEKILDDGGFKSPSTLRDYIEHEVSNFVVQNLLATLRNQEQASEMIHAVLPLISSGYVVEAMYKRRGVLWRITEQAAKYVVCQQEIMDSLNVALKGKTQKEFVLELLLMNSADAGEKLVLNVPGSHTIRNLLRFEPNYSTRIVNGILELSDDDLELLAKDNLGSRSVWEGILEGPVSVPVFSGAMPRLLRKMNGRWATLASDRVGHHVTIKMFQNLVDIDDRKCLVEELSTRRSRLNGCNMGRKVMDVCLIREFSAEGEVAWKALVRKMMVNSNWISDLTESKEAELSWPKQKRKSERDENGGSKQNKKAARAMPTAVESIMDAIKLPDVIER